MSSNRELFRAAISSLKSEEFALLQVEGLIDELPVCILLLDGQGKILRMNSVAALALDTDEEASMGVSFRELVSDSCFIRLDHMKSQLHLQGQLSSAVVEAPLLLRSGRNLGIHAWRMRELKIPGKTERLFALAFSDISEIIQLKGQFQAAFTSLGGSMLVMSSTEKVSSPSSSSLELLLGVKLRADDTPQDLWQRILVNRVRQEGADGLHLLPFFLGTSKLIFNRMMHRLPKKIWLAQLAGGEPRCVSLNIVPIAGETLDQLMIIFEDRTALEAKEAEEAHSRAEARAQEERALQVDAIADKIVPLVIRELDALSSKIQLSVKSQALEDLQRYLHGYKGNARSLGLIGLASMIQNIELQLKRNPPRTGESWIDISKRTDKVEVEWRSTRKLLSLKIPREAIGDQSLAPEISQKIIEVADSLAPEAAIEELLFLFSSSNFVPLRDLSLLALNHSDELRRSLGKEAQLNVSIDNVTVDKRVFQDLSQILTHLIANAYVHGIESEETRRSQGKPKLPQINCSITLDRSGLLIHFSDDGAGIDVSTVKRKALGQGLFTHEQLKSMKDSESLNLIFQKGVSTSMQAGLHSGFGLGLHAVQRSVSARQGKIQVKSLSGEGCQFQLWLPRHYVNLDTRFRALSPFLLRLRGLFDGRAEHAFSPSLFELNVSYLSRYDFQKSIYALTAMRELISGSKKRPVRVEASLTGARPQRLSFRFVCLQKEDFSTLAADLAEPRFEYISEIVRAQGGSVLIEAGVVTVDLFSVFSSQQFPPFRVLLSPAAKSVYERGLNLLSNILKADGVSFAAESDTAKGEWCVVDQDWLDSLISEPLDIGRAKEEFLAAIPELLMLKIDIVE